MKCRNQSSFWRSGAKTKSSHNFLLHSQLTHFIYVHVRARQIIWDTDNKAREIISVQQLSEAIKDYILIISRDSNKWLPRAVREYFEFCLEMWIQFMSESSFRAAINHSMRENRKQKLQSNQLINVGSCERQFQRQFMWLNGQLKCCKQLENWKSVVGIQKWCEVNFTFLIIFKRFHCSFSFKVKKTSNKY
jgi:hypothetical protein